MAFRFSKPFRVVVFCAAMAGLTIIAVEQWQQIMAVGSYIWTGIVPPTKRAILEEGGKTLVWANGEVFEEYEWFDMTNSRIDPHTLQYGLGKDAIRSIEHPIFVKVDDPRVASSRIDDEMSVIGYAEAGLARAYPVPIMGRHEIVNDEFHGRPVTVGW